MEKVAEAVIVLVCQCVVINLVRLLHIAEADGGIREPQLEHVNPSGYGSLAFHPPFHRKV